MAVASGKRIYNCNDFWETPSNLIGCSKLEEARNKWKIKPNTEWNDKSNRNEIIAKWAWENQTGNCEENANVTYYILRKAGVTGSLRILFSNEWHGFTVWGVQYGGDLRQPLTWNPDALVLDSWLGKVLSPYDAYHNYYIGNGGNNPLEDRTLAFDRETCTFMDFSEGESNLCHVYTKWLRGPLDNYLIGVIVVNDELVLDREPENRWKPPLGYTPTSDRYNECRKLLPQAELDCEAANRKGIPIDIQLD